MNASHEIKSRTEMNETTIVTIQVTDFSVTTVTIISDAQGNDMAIVGNVHYDISDEFLFDAPTVVRNAVEWFINDCC